MFFASPQNLFPVIIITIETVLLLFQVFHLYARPTDQKRWWFLLLLITVLTYNIHSEFLHPPQLLLPSIAIDAMRNGILILLSFTVVNYYYKIHSFHHLRPFIRYGIVILIVTYVSLLILPDRYTVVLQGTNGMVVILSVHSISYLCIIFIELKSKYSDTLFFFYNKDRLLNILPKVLTLLCFALLPICLLSDFEDLDLVMVNTGLLLLSWSNIQKAIHELQREQLFMQRQNSSLYNFANETQPALQQISFQLQNIKTRYGLPNDLQELDFISANLDHLSTRLQHFKQQLNPASSEQTNISEVVKKKIQQVTPLAKKNEVLIIDHIPPALYMDSYTVHLDLILLTQMEMSIRNAEKFGVITISLKEENGVLSLLLTDKGITIIVILRKPSLTAPPLNVEIQNARVSPLPDGPRRPYLFLVEYSRSALSEVTTTLETKYNVSQARGTSEALEELNRINHVDLIICDLLDENFRQQLYEIEKFKNTPFLIVVEGKPPEKSIHSLHVNYLIKPFFINEMIEMVEALTDTITSETETLREAFGSLRKAPSQDVSEHPQQPFRDSFEYNCWRCELTPRETKIIIQLNRGLSHKEIAEELFISKKTVDTHVNNIVNKVRTTFKLPKLKGRVELLNTLEIRSSVVEGRNDFSKP